MIVRDAKFNSIYNLGDYVHRTRQGRFVLSIAYYTGMAISDVSRDR